jgi:hypothetical protein
MVQPAGFSVVGRILMFADIRDLLQKIEPGDAEMIERQKQGLDDAASGDSEPDRQQPAPQRHG